MIRDLRAGIPGAAVVPVPESDPVAGAVAAAIRGEAAGWDRLFDRFHGVVHRYAAARLGDVREAEEIAQEVFVGAVRTIGRLRDHREPVVEAWFLRIARHKVADRVRLRRRSEPAPGPEPVGADAVELAETRLAAAEVRRALEHLSDGQREVVVRRFVLDQSLEEVAAATGRRVGAVKALQHRALAALSRRLEGPEGSR